MRVFFLLGVIILLYPSCNSLEVDKNLSILKDKDIDTEDMVMWWCHQGPQL